MKKIYKILGCFLCCFTLFFGCIFLTGCGESGGNGGNQQQSVTLSSDEQAVYNAVKNSLSSFKNPGSVTVVSVSDEVLIGGRYLKISAQNGFGGYSTEMYQVSGIGLRGPITDYNSYSVDSSISVSKINQKLNEYKASMGWN